MEQPRAENILLKSLRTFKEFSILLILWIPSTFIIAILALFGIFRICIHWLARLLRPDLIPTNCTIDNIAIVNPSSEKPRMNLSSSCLLEDRIEAQLLRKRFEHVFLSSEELRVQFANLYCYYVKWGFFIFKKSVKTINLNERIVEKYLLLKNIKELEEYLGNYIELNDYGNNPNWQILLLHVTFKHPDKKSPNRNVKINQVKTVIVFKMDHGLCDGYSVTSMFDKMCGTDTANPVKQRDLSTLEKLYTFWQTPLNVYKHLTDLSRCDDIPWPHCKGGAKDEAHVSFGDLDLERFKRARRLANCRFATLFAVLQVEVTKKFLASKQIHASIPEYAWVGAPVGWPNHPAIYGGPLKNHFTLIAFRVKMKSTDLVSKIAEAEKDYWEKTRDNKIPAMLFFVIFPLSWGVPRFVLNLLTDFSEMLHINSKHGLLFSSNFLPPSDYRMLGVKVEAIYPHTRISSVVNTFRLQIFQVSFGDSIHFGVGGKKDTFQSKEDVDFIAKTLIPETFEEILSALEETVK